jgi:hypothetical protein
VTVDRFGPYTSAALIVRYVVAVGLRRLERRVARLPLCGGDGVGDGVVAKCTTQPRVARFPHYGLRNARRNPSELSGGRKQSAGRQVRLRHLVR